MSTIENKGLKRIVILFSVSFKFCTTLYSNQYNISEQCLIENKFSELASFHYEGDEKVKAAKRKAAEETLPFVLERLDQQVKENDGYFHNGTLSWADLTFVALLDYFCFMYESDLIVNYINLTRLKEKVLALPNIKSWIERRPDSEF